MKRSGVSSVFKVIDTADAEDAVELLASGVRARLFSVVWYPYYRSSSNNVDTSSKVELKNGASGSVLYSVGWGVIGETSSFNPASTINPVWYPSIPENGILFDDGIVAQGVEIANNTQNGMLSITITYQGMG